MQVDPKLQLMPRLNYKTYNVTAFQHANKNEGKKIKLGEGVLICPPTPLSPLLPIGVNLTQSLKKV